MQLTAESINNLKKLLKITPDVKIDKIIIEDGKIRGIDDEKSVAIIADNNVPDFGGRSIGLHQLKQLSNQIDLVSDGDNFVITTNEQGAKDGEYSGLKFKSDKMKAEFRAMNIANIRAPKSISDVPHWLITIEKEDVSSIIRAANSVQTEQIIVTSKNDGEVFIEFNDSVTSDTMSLKVSDDIKWIPETPKDNSVFVHYYLKKSILPLIRLASINDNVNLIIGERGMLQIEVDGLNFIVLPRIS